MQGLHPPPGESLVAAMPVGPRVLVGTAASDELFWD